MNNDISNVTHIESVKLSDDKNSVVIIDQTKLPNNLEYMVLDTLEKIFEAIYELRVRGAPAIGICAGYGMYIIAKKLATSSFNSFYNEFEKCADYINSSRPTAVNLSYALNRMKAVVLRNKLLPIKDILTLLENECIAIHNEDIEMCYKISEYGLSLVKDGFGILTHCNAGPLATSRYGTGLGTLFLGAERGLKFKVFCDETRPLLQGARLTSYELDRAGINTTLICDNMASIVMKKGFIDACFVGCDRVALNGDTANKIGTNGVAILAKHYNIPFYVFCPSSTIDFSCKTGDDIVIELRDGDEIKSKFFEKDIAPKNVKCYNPAFDVTDNSLITAIITEKGICYPPFSDSIKGLFELKH